MFVERARLDDMVERAARATESFAMKEEALAKLIESEREMAERCRSLMVTAATVHGADRQRLSARIAALGTARQQTALARRRAESERAAAAARLEELMREVGVVESRIKLLEENIANWRTVQRLGRETLVEHEAIEETARAGRAHHG